MSASASRRTYAEPPVRTAELTLLAPFLLGFDLVAWFSDAPQWAVASTLLLQLALFAIGVRARPAGLLLSLFVASMFTFLTGRIVAVGILGYKAQSADDWGMHLNDPTLVARSLFMQQVFLLAALGGVAIATKRGSAGGLVSRTTRDVPLQYAGITGMLAGVALYMENRISVVSSVNQTSYLDYYSSQSSLVSTTGRIGESLMIVGYAFVLAAIPKFRVFVGASLVIVGAHGFDLLMGRRAPFVLTLLLVIFYSLLRSAIAERSDMAQHWPTIGKIGLGALLLAPLIELLNAINQTRGDGATATAGESGNPLLEFFYSQGVSANLLVYAQTDVLSIPHDKIYTFGPLIEFVQARLLPGFDSSVYDGQTAVRAVEGYNFADIVSFRIMPSIYLRGGGYGSSALAELFWDFGWAGLFLGGLAFGLMFAFGGRVLSLSPLLAAAALIMSRQLLYAPRAPYLDWLVGTLNVFNIAAFAFLGMLYKLLQEHGRTERNSAKHMPRLRAAHYVE